MVEAANIRREIYNSYDPRSRSDTELRSRSDIASAIDIGDDVVEIMATYTYYVVLENSSESEVSSPASEMAATE